MQYYNLLEAKKLGYRTLITDSNKNCYCKSKADLFYNVDIFDTKNNLKLLSKLKKKKIKIRSIFVGGIDCTVTGATLAKKINLVTSGVKIANITKNKFL